METIVLGMSNLKPANDRHKALAKRWRDAPQNILIWLKGGFYFSCSGHKSNCWLKIVIHWNKRDNGVLCTGKEIKSGLKLARMETDVATHVCKLLKKKKPEYCDTN